MEVVITVTVEELLTALRIVLPPGVKPTINLVDTAIPLAVTPPLEVVSLPFPVPAASLPPGTVLSENTTNIRCWASTFGYKDPGDNGQGAFMDRHTGKNYNTNNKELIGVAVPIPILWATIGKVDYDGVNRGDYTVSVASPDSRRVLTKVPIVDLGPGMTVDGQRGLIVGKDGVGHYLDLTKGCCTALGVNYNDLSIVFYSIFHGDTPLEFKGLDAPKKTV